MLYGVPVIVRRPITSLFTAINQSYVIYVLHSLAVAAHYHRHQWEICFHCTKLRTLHTAPVYLAAHGTWPGKSQQTAAARFKLFTSMKTTVVLTEWAQETDQQAIINLCQTVIIVICNNVKQFSTIKYNWTAGQWHKVRTESLNVVYET